ncbi:MAG: autotransporter-associated beta strand repeat-containing protein, partial [Planctomycetales bacterium]|nr:autotransporter-associated beta strand repeat-containing protein [Planctomycetales bacterium]
LQLGNGGGGDVHIVSESVDISGFGVSGTRGALASWTGTNSWGGGVNVVADSSVFVNTGSLAINGVISGASNLSKVGGGSLTLGGAASNTLSGTLILDNGVTFFDKTGGAFAATGNVQMGAGNGNQPHLRMLQNEQFGPGVVMSFANVSGAWGRFDLQGTTQTLAGLNAGTVATQAGAVVQNERFGGGGTAADGTLTLNGSGSYLYHGYVRDEDDGGHTFKLNLVKSGTGDQTIVGPNVTYTGTTTVNDGTLTLQTTGVLTGAQTVNGGTLRWVNENNGGGSSKITGVTTVNAPGTLEVDSTIPFTTRWNHNALITGDGTLNKVGTGVFGINGPIAMSGQINVLEGRLHNDNVTGNWTGNTADMFVAAGAVLDLRANDIYVDALDGPAGAEIWNSHTAGGGDTLYIGVANGSGNFAGVIGGTNTGANDTPNAATTHVVKRGTGSQNLSGANIY